jgi:hypothetical protein
MRANRDKGCADSGRNVVAGRADRNVVGQAMRRWPGRADHNVVGQGAGSLIVSLDPPRTLGPGLAALPPARARAASYGLPTAPLAAWS